MPDGALVADGGDEVVGIGHVVVDEALAGHPAVADRAAGDEPPVRHRGVQGREGRPPPRLAVPLLVDLADGDARLAVRDVPDGHRIHCRLAWHAEPHRRRVAELLRPVDDVRLGAVVVREREEACHPLTDPCVRPLTIQRWRTMKISTTGNAASTTPAQNGPHSCPNSSEMNPKRPTGSVYLSGAWSS